MTLKRNVRDRTSAKMLCLRSALVQLFGLDLDVLFACCLLLPVLLHPGVEGLACCGIAAGESERCNIGVGDVHLRGGVRRDDADEGVDEGSTRATVEEIADDLRAVLTGDS